MAHLSGGDAQPHESTLGERLLFVIWLSGKILGAENAKQFAEVIGKGASQLSKWIKEDPRPSWESVKLIADHVRVDALWLDEPTRPGAKEPADFAQWIQARRARETARRKRKRGA